MSNRETFENSMREALEKLFADDPEYGYAASVTTPAALAAKLTASLAAGTANKDGKAIKAACKAAKIKHTYKAIEDYLAG